MHITAIYFCIETPFAHTLTAQTAMVKKILRFSFFFLDFTLSSTMHKYYVVDEIYGFVKFDRVV